MKEEKGQAYTKTPPQSQRVSLTPSLLRLPCAAAHDASVPILLPFGASGKPPSSHPEGLETI